MLNGSRVIALEEHFWIDELRPKALMDRPVDPELARRMSDFGGIRLDEMAAAGIDFQVVSHAPCSVQNLDPAESARLARLANAKLHEEVLRRPDRFAGFATLPTPDPDAAARELEYCVRNYGFKGAMILGLTRGRFLDGAEYRPLFAAAEALSVPVYIHPGLVSPAVAAAYYEGYQELYAAGMGFTVETAVHAARLILSGLFDEHPKLQLILGHLGEALPYLLWRIDWATSRNKRIKRKFSDYLKNNFYITISGNYSPEALRCCLEQVGPDRVMYSVDWPYSSNQEASEFMKTMPLAEDVRRKILSGNAEKLLQL